MYTNNFIRVSWAGVMSGYFKAINGVKQGGVISPVLFCMYINDLLIRLSVSGVGCHIGCNFVGALAYADDIVLIAPTPSAMRTLLSLCDCYAVEYDIVFNAKKSKFLAVVSRKRRFLLSDMRSCVFHVGGNPIENVTSFSHLGHIITSHLDDYDDILYRRNCFMGQVNNVLCFFKGLDWHVRVKLFRAYCSSIYGSELWDLSNESVGDFCIAWRKALRRIIDLPYNTHSYLLPILSDTIPVLDELFKRTARFVVSCLTASSLLVRHIAWYGVVFARCDSVIGRNTLGCCERYDWPLQDFATGSVPLTNYYFVDRFRKQLSDVQVATASALSEAIALHSGLFELRFSDGIFLSRADYKLYINYFATM